MSDVAAWTGEDQAGDEDMSMAVNRTAAWLPAKVAKRIAAEDREERRIARAEERARADHAELLRERGLEAFRAAAEARGDEVSALALATGNVKPRTVGDVFAEALAASEREDARSAARERNTEYVGDIGRSSGWPGSAYEVDSQIARAQQNHRDLVAYKARHNYPAAESAVRSGSTSLSRSAGPHAPGERVYGRASQGEIVRVATAAGNLAWPQ